jgi:hypothetical protein
LLKVLRGGGPASYFRSDLWGGGFKEGDEGMAAACFGGSGGVRQRKPPVGQCWRQGVADGGAATKDVGKEGTPWVGVPEPSPWMLIPATLATLHSIAAAATLPCDQGWRAAADGHPGGWHHRRGRHPQRPPHTRPAAAADGGGGWAAAGAGGGAGGGVCVT